MRFPKLKHCFKGQNLRHFQEDHYCSQEGRSADLSRVTAAIKALQTVTESSCAERGALREGEALERECREAAASSQPQGLLNPRCRHQCDPQRTKSCSEAVLVTFSHKVHPFRIALAMPLPPVYAHEMGEGRKKATLHFACNEQRKQEIN